MIVRLIVYRLDTAVCCMTSTFKVQFGAQIWLARYVTLLVMPSLDLRSEQSYGDVVTVTKNRDGLI